jgi:hypothetical protein
MLCPPTAYRPGATKTASTTPPPPGPGSTPPPAGAAAPSPGSTPPVAVAHSADPALVADGYTVRGDDVLARFDRATVEQMAADLAVANADSMPGEIAVLRFDGAALLVLWETRRRAADPPARDRPGVPRPRRLLKRRCLSVALDPSRGDTMIITLGCTEAAATDRSS